MVLVCVPTGDDGKYQLDQDSLMQQLDKDYQTARIKTPHPAQLWSGILGHSWPCHPSRWPLRPLQPPLRPPPPHNPLPRKNDDTVQEFKFPIERVHWHHAALQHGRRIAQTDLGIQGSHAHHARTRSSCAWTTNGGVHGATVTPNNVKRCLHKWILIAVAIEAAMLEDSMASHEIAL